MTQKNRENPRRLSRSEAGDFIYRFGIVYGSCEIHKIDIMPFDFRLSVILHTLYICTHMIMSSLLGAVIRAIAHPLSSPTTYIVISGLNIC